ncbi:MAG TPA: patatin-like phospholipase family protein [Gemmatimonadales bacterium]|jgi:NTE family protein|nr:patatin-like phospholipase family protein [Gemmatimonadales bacterium]
MTPGAGVVLLLSGGGAKAAAHTGAIRALAEAGIVPTRIVGTSMGAVIGACIGAGLTPEETVRRLLLVGSKGIVRSLLAPWGGLWLDGLLRSDALHAALSELVPARKFDELRIPLTVTTTDLDTGALVPLGDGGDIVPLIDALHASCALPVFYPPVTLVGRRLGDGGLRGVVPFAAAAEVDAELVVAVDIGPGFDTPPDRTQGRYPALVARHNDATGILMAANTAASLALWRADSSRPPLLYVRPRTERDATFRVEQVALYAEEGYRATRTALTERARP